MRAVARRCPARDLDQSCAGSSGSGPEASRDSNGNGTRDLPATCHPSTDREPIGAASASAGRSDGTPVIRHAADRPSRPLRTVASTGATLEEVVFQAGRDALADQDSVVTGIRQRTGTLLAAHALVASFLGATTVTAKGLHGFSWSALAALVVGLAISAVLLSNWKLRFAVDAPDPGPLCRVV